MRASHIGSEILAIGWFVGWLAFGVTKVWVGEILMHEVWA